MSEERREWRAVLGMPGTGLQTPAAGRGFWRASKHSEDWIDNFYKEGSLLGTNFNALWCHALTLRHRGQQVDYFAMLHSDIEPELYWLDKLIDELEARNLDVLSVVAPIKDTRGLTSLALDHPGGGEWHPLCRLTMDEIHRLPATFTADDVGFPLLLNTGCWVAKFDMAWATKVHFTVNDRIVFNAAHNQYEPQDEPEDWFFSRLLNQLGLRIGATRKVKLAHAGSLRVRNTHSWGDERFDREYIDQSPIPTVMRDGFRYPFDVDGWLTFEESHALWNLARGKRVLEIGSYCGKSACSMVQTAKSIHAIDPHDGRATPRPKDTLSEMRANLDRYDEASRVPVTIHRTTTKELAAGGGLGFKFDFVFIDGAHDVDSVRIDIEFARSVLEPGGLIAFHDYRQFPGQHDGGWDPGVTEAIDEFLGDGGGKLVSTHDTVAVVQPPACQLLEA